MALLFIDGFDYASAEGARQKWTQVTDNRNSATYFEVTNTNARRAGTYYLKLANSSSSGTSGWVQTAFAAKSTLYIGFAFKKVEAANGIMFMLRDTADTSQCAVEVNADGSFSLYRGTTTLLDTTPVNQCYVGEWNYFEFKLVISDSVGAWEVRKNGASIHTGTGFDTRASAAYTTATTLYLQGPSAYGHCAYDDLYIDDAQFHGDCRVDTLHPTANGTYAQWTPLAGQNYENVDEVSPDNDTSYNSTVTAGAIDTYVMDNLSALGSTIYGVALNLSLRKTDAGTVICHAMTRIGSTDFEGTTDHNVSDVYRYAQEIYEVNPDDGAAWEEADVNGAEFGVKLDSIT